MNNYHREQNNTVSVGKPWGKGLTAVLAGFFSFFFLQPCCDRHNEENMSNAKKNHLQNLPNESSRCKVGEEKEVVIFAAPL
jgi:hypothetical protein